MILRNALRTPDGTVIESKFRHDYVTHGDANGKQYMVDGGKDYLRRSANGDEVDMSIESTDDHAHNREYVTWGTYGKEGLGPYKLLVLKDMDTDHIEAIIETQYHISDELWAFFDDELEYRKTNEG